MIYTGLIVVRNNAYKSLLFEIEFSNLLQYNTTTNIFDYMHTCRWDRPADPMKYRLQVEKRTKTTTHMRYT